MKNYGYIEPVIQPKEYMFGGLLVPAEVLQEDGQWGAFLPDEEVQRNGFDTYNCTGFGTLNALEMLFNRKFGVEMNWSERFTGVMANTYPPGNSPHKVAEAIRKHGVIEDNLLPFADAGDIDAYYSPDPMERKYLRIGQRWLKEYRMKHEWVISNLTIGDRKKKLIEALKYSPLGISVDAWQERNGLFYKNGRDNHWTVLYGYVLGKFWKVYDSYKGNTVCKKLEWNWDFGFAKRYYLSERQRSCWLVQIFKEAFS